MKELIYCVLNVVGGTQLVSQVNMYPKIELYLSEKKRVNISSDDESRNKSDPSPSDSNVNPTVDFCPTTTFMTYNLSKLSQCRNNNLRQHFTSFKE